MDHPYIICFLREQYKPFVFDTARKSNPLRRVCFSHQVAFRLNVRAANSPRRAYSSIVLFDSSARVADSLELPPACKA